MQDAFGVMGWKPAEFWASTLTEFLVAIEGWNRANTVEPAGSPPTNKELDALIARYG